MATKKRHSKTEISAKLAQANLLAQEGKRQGDIARALEISVMTFHRWRKAQTQHNITLSPGVRKVEQSSGPDQFERIAALELENSHLRRLVTDLLLEKIELEETLGSRPKRHR